VLCFGCGGAGFFGSCALMPLNVCDCPLRALTIAARFSSSTLERLHQGLALHLGLACVGLVKLLRYRYARPTTTRLLPAVRYCAHQASLRWRCARHGENRPRQPGEEERDLAARPGVKSFLRRINNDLLYSLHDWLLCITAQLHLLRWLAVETVC